MAKAKKRPWVCTTLNLKVALDSNDEMWVTLGVEPPEPSDEDKGSLLTIAATALMSEVGPRNALDIFAGLFPGVNVTVDGDSLEKYEAEAAEGVKELQEAA